MASQNRNDYVDRLVNTHGQKAPHRYAACLYKARQTNEGHWIWEKTQYIGETRLNKGKAIQDAQIMKWKFGLCRVYPEGLGFKRIT